MIPLKYWLLIGLIIATMIGGNMLISKAYDRGAADQKTAQAEADKAATIKHNAEKEQIENDARKQIALADAAADRARATANGLRGQLDQIKRLAGNAAGTVPAGTSARDAVVLLADLFGQCSDKYSELAIFADKAHNAGRICEASYDAIKKAP